MSEHDLQRIEVLSRVIDGRMTLVNASHVLSISTRQVQRLLARIRSDGAMSIRHQFLGKRSNNHIDDNLRNYAVALIRQRYVDFGPTLVSEMLFRNHQLRVSRETLRHWMIEGGVWLSRKQRRTL